MVACRAAAVRALNDATAELTLTLLASVSRGLHMYSVVCGVQLVNSVVIKLVSVVNGVDLSFR